MEVSHSFDTLNTTGRRSQCSAHHAGHCELDLPPPPSSVIGGLRAPPELCTADSVLQCPAVCTADKPPLAPSHRQLSSCQSLSVRTCPSVSARSYSDTLRRRHHTLDRSVRSIRSHADRWELAGCEQERPDCVQEPHGDIETITAGLSGPAQWDLLRGGQWGLLCDGRHLDTPHRLLSPAKVGNTSLSWAPIALNSPDLAETESIKEKHLTIPKQIKLLNRKVLPCVLTNCCLLKRDRPCNNSPGVSIYKLLDYNRKWVEYSCQPLSTFSSIERTRLVPLIFPL